MPFAHRFLAPAFGETQAEAEDTSVIVNAKLLEPSFTRSGPKRFLASAFGEAEAKAEAENVVAEMRKNESEPPDSKAAEIDAKVAAEKEAGEMPVENVEVTEEPDTSQEVSDHYDPRIPRRLLENHVFRNKGAWDMRPFGLRSLGKVLFVCDTDDERKLLEQGRCGVVGTRQQIDGTSLFNKVTGNRTLPVKRWDDLRFRWTSEDAPYVTIREWKLPRAADGIVDLTKIPAIPKTMTEEKPGFLLNPIEGSAGALLPSCIALATPSDLVASCRRRAAWRRANSRKAGQWKEQCINFL